MAQTRLNATQAKEQKATTNENDRPPAPSASSRIPSDFYRLFQCVATNTDPRDDQLYQSCEAEFKQLFKTK